MPESLEKLLQQEQELQFTNFDAETAWELGVWLVEYARREKLPITIDIQRGEHQVFHASRPGTSLDNDEWVKRKVRVVYRFEHSSFFMGQSLKQNGITIEDKYLLSEWDYAPHGGCFPIIVKGTGVVGVITISGLTQEEDHALVVKAIRTYLNQQ